MLVYWNMRQTILILLLLTLVKLSVAQSWKFVNSTPEKILSNFEQDTTVLNIDTVKDKSGNINMVGITLKENSSNNLIGYLFMMNRGTCEMVKEMYYGEMPKELHQGLVTKYPKNLDYFIDKAKNIGISLENNTDSYNIVYTKLPNQ